MITAVQGGYYEIASWLLDNDGGEFICCNYQADGSSLMKFEYGDKSLVVDIDATMDLGWFAVVERLHRFQCDRPVDANE